MSLQSWNLGTLILMAWSLWPPRSVCFGLGLTQDRILAFQRPFHAWTLVLILQFPLQIRIWVCQWPKCRLFHSWHTLGNSRGWIHFSVAEVNFWCRIYLCTVVGDEAIAAACSQGIQHWKNPKGGIGWRDPLLCSLTLTPANGWCSKPGRRGLHHLVMKTKCWFWLCTAMGVPHGSTRVAPGLQICMGGRPEFWWSWEISLWRLLSQGHVN